MVCRLVVENFAASNKIIPNVNSIIQKENKEIQKSDSEDDFQE